MLQVIGLSVLHTFVLLLPNLKWMHSQFFLTGAMARISVMCLQCSDRHLAGQCHISDGCQWVWLDWDTSCEVKLWKPSTLSSFSGWAMSRSQLSWVKSRAEALWMKRLHAGAEENRGLVVRDELAQTYGDVCRCDSQAASPESPAVFHCEDGAHSTRPRITTWEAGWNVTNAIQVSTHTHTHTHTHTCIFISVQS